MLAQLLEARKKVDSLYDPPSRGVGKVDGTKASSTAALLTGKSPLLTKSSYGGGVPAGKIATGLSTRPAGAQAANIGAADKMKMPLFYPEDHLRSMDDEGLDQTMTKMQVAKNNLNYMNMNKSKEVLKLNY